MPYKDPEKRRTQQKAYRLAHPDKIAEYRRRMGSDYDHKRYMANREENLARSKRWREEHKDQDKERQKRYRARDPEKWKAISRATYARHKVKIREQLKEQHKILRAKVVIGYGSKCACCGEAEDRFLTVDHVNNDGYIHRKTVEPGKPLYKWLIKNGFPKDKFQLLCWNCNCGRHHNGGICPHKEVSNG